VKGRGIVPIAQLGSRPPEAGRIRLGVKAGKAMKSISTFRFTSPNREVIDQLAALYGGTAKPWHEPSANPPNQFEVISTVDEIPVFITPDGLSTGYELWDKGGRSRECDGETCNTPRAVGNDYEMTQCPCICVATNERACSAKTRLQVIIPAIAFRGVWRLETNGWNAAVELPWMFELIATMGANGKLVQALLGMEQRKQTTAGQTRNFVVPKLSLENTVLELQAGHANALTVRADGPSIAAVPPMAAISAGDNEVVDAEVIDDELLQIEALLSADAENFALPVERYITAVKAQAGGDREKMRKCSAQVRAGAFEPVGFQANGRVQWRKLG
jgi:hypothetical protein